MRDAIDRGMRQYSAEALLFIHEAPRGIRPRNSARTKRRRDCVTPRGRRARGMLEEEEFLAAPRGFSRPSEKAAPRCLSPTAVRASFFNLSSSLLSFLLLPFPSLPLPPVFIITADEPLTLFSREDIRRDHIFRHDPVFSLSLSLSPREYTPLVQSKTRAL